MDFDDFKDAELQEKLKNATNPPKSCLSLPKRRVLSLPTSSSRPWATAGSAGTSRGIDVCEKYDAERMHECVKYKNLKNQDAA